MFVSPFENGQIGPENLSNLPEVSGLDCCVAWVS